jgi:hypothetical protein
MDTPTPRMGAVVERLAYQREKLEVAVDGVADFDAGAVPPRDAWTIADHVHHLLVVESGVIQICRSLLHAAEAGGAPPAATRPSSDDPRAELEELLVPLARFADQKFVTLPQLMPEPDMPLGETMRRLRTARGQLYAFCAYAAPYDLRGYRHYHYYLKDELDPYTWLLVHAEHEARHVRKIRAARADIGV